MSLNNPEDGDMNIPESFHAAIIICPKPIVKPKNAKTSSRLVDFHL